MKRNKKIPTRMTRAVMLTLEKSDFIANSLNALDFLVECIAHQF
jgi:hypothetical protein